MFIPVAESSGIIVPLGHWVLVQACEAWLALDRAGAAMTLSINVSPLQFRQPDFVNQVRAVLSSTGIPARQLVFEVTEGLLIEEIDQTIARMHELAALGIRFSVDDFGTGYSNLAYLRKMPLYELKIDKSFLRETPSDNNSTAIVNAILAMAAHLGLRVVAEGVESAAQADFLSHQGGVIMQGYHFRDPVRLAIEACSTLFESRGQSFNHSGFDLPIVVMADETRITQIVSNILNNASKYTPPHGNIRLELGTSLQQAEIRVIDDGVGLDPEAIERIFSMFEQVENQKLNSRGGLGIGLAIARQLVQLHRGSIAALSKGVGCGSEFLVTFPQQS